MNLISQDAIDVERWRRIESVLDFALDLEPHEVAAYLDRACAGSPELRAEIEALLEADRRGRHFLSVPAAARIDLLDDGDETRVETGASAAVVPPAPAPPPERIGRYRVVGELGRGGMGIVYRCVDEAHDREVAIKALPANVAADAERLERFLREAKLLGTLHHPNIAGIHGIERAAGQRYLILELVRGGTLAERLRGGPLPLREALDACAQIADALAAAHAFGIVHRDLKPGNVMLTADGLVKVLDYGLAVHVSQGDAKLARSIAATAPGDIFHSGARLGTPGYMSPEQILGLDQDARADLFALGAVLYECLTGSRAFPGATVYAVIAATLNAPADAKRLPAQTPEPVRALLTRVLEKVRERRKIEAREAAEVLGIAVADSTARPARVRAGALGALRLPEASLPLVGREREIADARALLERASLVTLVGSAGCGKTRLAVEVARASHGASADETWFANLAEAGDAAAVAAAIASAAGLRDPSEAALESGLEALLGPRRALLVLDNCDRVPAIAAALAGRLLTRAPRLRILATSREWLGAAREQVLRVAPLSVPDTESPPTRDAAGAAESVRLFVACANQAPGGFRLTDANAGLVAGICRELDGVPLAIEVTAALLRRQSLDAVAEGLRQWRGERTPDARHDALLAAIELSYDRLADDERRFFRALSVFAGGWTLEAAASVCAADPDPFATLDHLTRLADKSLVVIERADRIEPRYRFLESIQHFAAGRCEALGESAALRERHVAWFLDLSERSAPALLSGSDQVRALAALEADHPNLLAALRACESPERAAFALRLAGAVWFFWYIRGHFARGREALARVLALRGAEAPTPARAQALFAAGGLALFQGDYAEGRGLSRAALELYEALGDELGVARSSNHLALCESGEGRHDAAREFLERAIAIFRSVGDTRRLATALNNLGALKRQRNDFAAALPDHEEALDLQRRVADRDGMIVTLVNLGLAAARVGRRSEAARHVAEALAWVRDLRAKRAGAASLEVAAEVLDGRGRIEDGVRALGAARSLRAAIGLPADPWWRAAQVALADRLRATLGAERFEKLAAEGAALGFERAIDEARIRLEELAGEGTHAAADGSSFANEMATSDAPAGTTGAGKSR